MRRWRLEITEKGYLILPQEIAAEFFPENACVALLRESELQILPLRATNAGGLLLKQRNARGDRSVLVHESLPLDYPKGFFDAFWDAENRVLRIALTE